MFNNIIITYMGLKVFWKCSPTIHISCYKESNAVQVSSKTHFFGMKTKPNIYRKYIFQKISASLVNLAGKDFVIDFSHTSLSIQITRSQAVSSLSQPGFHSHGTNMSVVPGRRRCPFKRSSGSLTMETSRLTVAGLN